MSFQNQVTIGPEFFAKAFNDYANWHWALAREFMQNSIDCGSTKINVYVTDFGEDTRLVVDNNGSPMTREILTTKLLALGGSGKNFHGSVGGFGKAKELLYYAHKEYQIVTGNCTVKGSGAGYNLEHDDESWSGTKSVVLVAGKHVKPLVDAFMRFAMFAQWSGELRINGEHVATSLHKGSHRRNLTFGKVYTNKFCSNMLVVRIGGIPMFTSYVDLKRCVVVELEGTSAEVLTSNRDQLRYTQKQELQNFITEISVDKRSALKDKAGTQYLHYEGRKLAHRTDVGIQEIVQALTAAKSAAIMQKPGQRIESVETAEVTVSSSISNEFVLKNETGMEIPAYFLPESFSTHSRKLVKIWGRLLVELHRLFEHSADFAIGFLFDEETEAEHENGKYGTVYYLNPAVVVRKNEKASRSFKLRFQLTERNRLLMIALHEFVHGSKGLAIHDENYANTLTDMAAKVMDNRKRFNWCFAE